MGKPSERVFSLVKHLQGNGQPLEGVSCSLLFIAGQGQSLHELNKGTLVSSQAEGQGPQGKPLNKILITRLALTKNSKAESQRIDAFELRCLEKTLESPLDCKEIKPVNPK